MSNFGASSFNRTNSDVTFTDALNILKRNIFLNFNCHAIATIQSFDAETQLVTVSINYKKTFLRADPATGVYRNVLQEYPPVLDCPIICLQGGGSALTFPITQGDTCILLFNDRDMDAWHHTGQVGAINTQRLHSFADAIALVGIRSGNNPIPDYDPLNIGIKATGEARVKIYNDADTLNGLLQNLTTELQNLTSAIAAITVSVASAPGTSGPPLNAAAITAIGTQIGVTAASIGELLA